MKNNLEVLKRFKARFKVSNPDRMPGGKHITNIVECGFYSPNTTPEEAKRKAAELGYNDESLTIMAVFENEQGRIPAFLPIAGYERYSDAIKNKIEWVKAVEDRIKKKDRKFSDPKWVAEQFDRFFSKSSDGRDYLVVVNEDGTRERQYNNKKLDDSIDFFNKLASAALPLDYPYPQTDDFAEYFELVCKDLHGKKVGITVKESIDKDGNESTEVQDKGYFRAK